ncbi:MAG: B12-binding domain-containing radical SAM protein [Bacteroidetes bacterium]|nr:B12-binding domain-containing radical SAM protein [Bacteroidota bacterium]
MNCLLVSPTHPNTFWSFRYALRFISRKACFPPLGLITVAAMLPGEWKQRLVDMNTQDLRDEDIRWADIVFLSAMSIQSESADDVIARCQSFGKRIVAGGPHFTSSPRHYDHVDHLVLNEAEITLPRFLADLEAGCPDHIYTTDAWPDLSVTPIPKWELVPMKRYSSMNLQYSRGCPYDCDFCDITVLYGRNPRTKSRAQVIGELDTLLARGWTGPVFFVDDNFIGNRRKLKVDILPAIAEWMDMHQHPFQFNTEASINLADDAELMTLMVRAGFEAVFIGIETTEVDSLAACGKGQNLNRDLAESVRMIQRAGLEVQGGFILGFDEDQPGIFDRLASFIQETAIVTAMVGLLNAPTGTRLHARLKAEGRLLHDFNGNNTDTMINFIPNMDLDQLRAGYGRVVTYIYSPEHYYARVREFLRNWKPRKKNRSFSASNIIALLRSMVVLGVIGRERVQYWRLFFWSLARGSAQFSLAIQFAIYGFHFRKTAEDSLQQ